MFLVLCICCIGAPSVPLHVLCGLRYPLKLTQWSLLHQTVPEPHAGPPRPRKGIQSEGHILFSSDWGQWELHAGSGHCVTSLGTKRTKEREHRLWPSLPSRCLFLGDPFCFCLGENWVCCMKDHFLYAHLVHREGRLVVAWWTDKRRLKPHC